MVNLLIQVYLAGYILLLAGKDADSYLLKDRVKNSLTDRRIKRWHADGVLLFLVGVLPCIFLYKWWAVYVEAFIIRLAVFDLAFNYWASLPVSYLGSTATLDRFFTKIFGENGAQTKSAYFLLLLAAFNLTLIIFFKSD